ncbi:phage tail protein [Bartonella sp. LJL80]
MAVFTGLATLIGGLFSSVLGGALLRVVLGVGLSLLGQTLAGKKKKQSEQSGVRGEIAGGGDLPRSILLGRICTAGSLVYANTWGRASKTPNAYVTQVIALADHRIKGISALWVNGEPVDIDQNNSSLEGYNIPQYDGCLFIKPKNGEQTVADPLLVQRVNNSERPWPNTRVGYNVAYSIMTAKANPELFTGFPQFKFEVLGRRLYDPSRDSSVGGRGSQRWADTSTWGGDGDDLPAVQIYNILRGIYEYDQNGVRTWVYGLQNMPESRLPVAHWISQINKCRQLVDGPNGQEEQYLSGIEITVDTPIGDTIEKLLTACNGRLVEAGGFYKIYVGEPDAPVYSFTDADILSTEEQTFTPFFGLAESVNGVSATYPEINEGWNTKTAPALYNRTYEAEDGDRRLMTSVQLDTVYRASQVQRLMLSSLREARRARRHTFLLPPEAWVLEPGDIVSWTSERNGYVNKLFRVDGTIDHPNNDVTVDLTEVDPSDYDWDQQNDYTPPEFAPLGPVRPQPQPMIDWTATASQVDDYEGNARRPAIRLGWDGEQEDVYAVQYEVALAYNLEVVVRGRTDRPEVGSLLISQDVLPLTDYAIRGKYVSSYNRQTLWSDWLTVRTLDIRLGPKDMYPIDLGDLTENINKNLEFSADTWRYVLEEMQRLGEISSDQGAENYLQQQTIKRELSVSLETASANFTEQITVAVGDLRALAARTQSLEAKVEDPDTGLTATANAVDLLKTEVKEVDGKLTATAEAVTIVRSQVGNVTAEGLFRVKTEATAAGSSSTIGLTAAASDASGPNSASLFIDAKTDGTSRVSVVGNQFVVMNPSNKGQYYLPFLIQDGKMYANEMYVNWAKITDVQIDTAQIRDGSITSAKIGYLEVQTSNLGFNSVTKAYQNTGLLPPSAQATPIINLSTNNPQANTSLVGCNYNLYISPVNSNSDWGINVYLSNATTGNRIWEFTHTGRGAGWIAGSGLNIDASAINGTNTYQFWAVSNGSVSATVSRDQGFGKISALIWER